MILLQTPVVVETAQPLSYFQLFTKGGPIVIPILLLLVVSLYFFGERLFYFNITAKMDDRMLDDYIEMLRKGELKSVMDKTARSRDGLSRVINYGLNSMGNSLADIERSLESATGLEISRMEKNLGYLGIIAGIAPMLGFIGTIAGIIQIFYDISLSDNISIGIIAGGLYQKMITSGLGLTVGVLAYSLYHILTMRIDHFSLKLQERLLLFLSALQK
ncbi:MAG: MotA/TolQ/ExbB proton channel family protein [Bacteroidia bacterium]|nr:MotA/TolQ/ExbB proton channel family protein [Bacteroidia bacterium]